jgi:predicted DNA-binding WGR domain protein
LLYLGNIINISLRYINVTSQNKLRRRQTQNDEGSAKKNQNGTSSMNQFDDEADLLKRKLEEEKARKRTRGPYRKSHTN